MIDGGPQLRVVAIDGAGSVGLVDQSVDNLAVVVRAVRSTHDGQRGGQVLGVPDAARGVANPPYLAAADVQRIELAVRHLTTAQKRRLRKRIHDAQA